MPEVPKGPDYTVADPKMRFRVWQDGRVPGSVSLETLRQLSVATEAGLDGRIKTLETAQTSTTNSITTLQSAQSAEAKTRAQADDALAQMASGMVSSEAQARKDADAGLDGRITAEAAARSSAITAEAKARSDADTAEASARTAADAQEKTDRQAADTAEAKARADADTAEATARAKGDADEAKARAAADAGLQTQIDALKAVVVPLLGSLVLPAGISILSGKSTRTVAVTGLRRNDNIVVTPNAALPTNISMGEAYCLTDGTLTVVLVNSATLGLSIATAQTIPLGIIALRPQT